MFEAVTIAAAVAEYEASRAAFLASVQTHPRLARFFAAGAPVRYVRSDATGAGDGTADTAAGAWTTTQFAASESGLAADTRVVFTGVFSAVSLTLTAADVLLDCRNAEMSPATLVSSGIIQTVGGGVFKIVNPDISIPNNSSRFTFSENGYRFEAWSDAHSTGGCAKMPAYAADAGADTITMSLPYPLADGDWIVRAGGGGTLTGFSAGTQFFVINAGAYSVVTKVGRQTIQISTSVGGSAVDIGSALTGTVNAHSNFSGRHNIPTKDTLTAGQAAYEPIERAIYFMPRDGSTVTGKSYWLHFLSSGDVPALQITGNDSHVLGGFFHTSATGTVQIGGSAANAGVWAVTSWGGNDGIRFVTCTAPTAAHCEVAYCVQHGIGSSLAGDPEPNMHIHDCHVHHTGNYLTDFGDLHALTSSDDSDNAVWERNVLQHIARARDGTDVPDVDTVPFSRAGFTLDSSNHVIIRNNYLHMAGGKGSQVSINTGGSQDLDDVQIYGNVFDFRDATTHDIETAPIRAHKSGTAVTTSGYVVRNNLFLLGAGFGAVPDDDTVSTADLMAVVTMWQNTATPHEITFVNNIVYGPNLDAIVFALTGYSTYDTPTVVSDGNAYCLGSGATLSFEADSGKWGALVGGTIWALTNIADWTTDRGNDGASIVMTESAMAAAATGAGLPRPGAALLDGGVGLPYIRDRQGKQSRKHIGCYGAARLRET